MASPDTKVPSTIAIRPPSKYALKQSQSADANPNPNASAFVPPPLEWLYRTWAVTHSTLSMWRSAQNVRITYKPYKPDNSKPPPSSLVVDDLVEYEKKGAGSGSGVKSVEGIDKPADPAGSSSSSSSSSRPGGAWDWRGKGWLKIASSHWEVLGYGERPRARAGDEDEGGVERWVVTWFAPTLFTQEGLDIYSDRREGLSQETLDAIVKALKELDGAPKIVTLVEKHMQPVAISLPWQEGV